MEINQKISRPDFKKFEDDGEQEQKSETFAYQIFTPEMRGFQTEAVAKSREGLSGVERGKGTC